MTVIDAAARFAAARIPGEIIGRDIAAVQGHPPIEHSVQIPAHRAPAALARSAAGAAAGIVGMSASLVREQLLVTALALMTAAVIEGAPDPLNAALDLLAAEDPVLEGRVWDLVAGLERDRAEVQA